MQIELTRKFQKQVENCNDKHIKSKILAIVQAVIDSENLNEFPNLKKLTGYKNFYRIRLGNFRIGLVIEDKTIVFAAFDHRSDIYKYFP
jgi:mRNA interferase RelE/StbE